MPPKFIIAGAPASGKGTQCEFLREEYNLVHLSTGDMLREAVKMKSKLGKEADSYMSAGKLLPDDIMISIILERLKQNDCASRGWLLDGFPRTATQAAALARANISCDVFIHLDVPDEILVERVVGRRSDPETGKIYHMKYSPPESDEIQARLVQRSDDTEEKVAVRIAAFHENLSSILDQYTDVTLKVDGNRSPKVIWAEIRQKANEMLFRLPPPRIIICGAPAR